MDKSAIHSTTLKARELLMGETRDLLQGIYGLDSKGDFEDVKRLPAVALPEVRATRKRLEKFLNDEEQAGLPRPEAVAKLVKETAFTHLNRLVAFKMMEARKLIRGTLDRYQESNANKFYLAEHEEDYKLYEQGSLPQNEVGEGPRDMAYRHFLLWQCAELSKEIKVLFDPENLASRLFPRPRALKSLLEMLNDPALVDAWSQEETVGWIYQYFNEDEKKDVFNRLYKKKQKIRPEDIPAATQLFTPRWIVKFLVQNTLGRQWMQMHPDSRLIEKSDYLVPLAGEIPSEKMKPVREIEILDPACGTMHFGLVAFDLLAEMYKEEMEKAGRPGWPEKPSVSSVEAIPAAIIANNIFGIDIDLRAVQLSALALYLKAKSLNPKAQITDSHLACAELQLPEDAKLEEFLKSCKFTLPVYERVIRRLWSMMRGGSGKGVGSLLSLEGAINLEVERERRTHLTSLQRFEDLADAPQDVARTEVWGPEFWDTLGDQIVMAFNSFADQQTASGGDESYFVGEASKGMRLLDIMRRRYDCVFTNPPYMARRNMNPELADFTEANYPNGKGDLYTAFIQRCLELTKEKGRLGMIAQQSFMFITSYEKLREEILRESAIEAVAHIGPHAFEDIGGEKVNTANFITRNETNQKKRSDAEGTYFRLVKEPDSEAKRLRFEQGLACLRVGEPDPTIFRYLQVDFDIISGSPWVYWITPGMRRLFVELPKLGETAQPRVGLQTGDNFRFLRFWWEIGEPRVAFGCNGSEEAQASGKYWFPYMKGGSFQRWYGNQEYIINWRQDGQELKSLTPISVIRNPSFYFQRGVTWTLLSAKGFTGRISPGGFIFDVNGMTSFPQDDLISSVLGIFNSKLCSNLLHVLNPTIAFQVGDLARLPFPTEFSKQLENLVDRAISLSRAEASEDETTFDFIAPPWSGTLKDTLTEIQLRKEALEDVEMAIDQEVYRLYDIRGEDRQTMETELSEPGISDNETENDGINDANEDSCINDEELALRWISYAMGIIMGRFQPGASGALGKGRFSSMKAEQLFSLADNDGVATLDEGHQDDLALKVWNSLEIALGEDGASEVVSTILGEGNPRVLLRRYLERDFWKRHLQQYRKRPVYWLLQSPAKSFSVYVFHELATRDTLPLIMGTRYVSGKINQLKNCMDEIQTNMKSAEGRAKKMLEMDLEDLETNLLDLEAFEAAIRRVLEQKDERGETVGWAPEIDDGIILNLAPLRELMPSWKEPEKYWLELDKGKYDWSYTAMRYWPDRVLEKCKTNKSFAIAHNMLDVYIGKR
ncbi:MAG: BREX-1 system adenine-specific DNA-methyltransferase PglX [Methanothrix sp.]|uniref:BREX-1 system adenine-specific DNA-methyltransferase PglX n=1 Tax=Methanothrix sp. TaxID=90426 RepID=UPI001B455B2C|nr:BREX-1 system adenine-specific DNA-methyltransferase PglX [Methanothrix sp.]MBP7068906.1 BREX-1 system adenine-specific DNA-methyltransferase PglX [Methanothrix sp.]